MKHILLFSNYSDPDFDNLEQSETLPNVVLMLDADGHGNQEIYYNFDPWKFR
jgi:hypothetical protein